MILLQYAKENRFSNPTFFVDDGYSGTNYDRPGFQAMLAEIEAGRVAVCITKDLSIKYLLMAVIEQKLKSLRYIKLI